MRRITFAAGALMLLLAACSKSSSVTPAAGGGGSAGGTTGAATVSLTPSSSLGSILTDSSGRTLYLYQKDSGTASVCTGSCAALWPPLTTTGTPTAGSGVTGSMLGTTMRADGSTQVTYNGHPLYLYVGDSGPGQTNGQGVQDFFVVNGSGNKVAGTTSGNGGGNGYGGGGGYGNGGGASGYSKY
jgi:predicted lipoprotein with Yx(FWY)xxD motif